MYLTAVIDWFSRYVLSWRLSNTLEGRFCLEALDEALAQGRPEIFNTDQGSQFTSREYTDRLEEAGVAVSRDGRGRALDNVFVERLWRSVKYEDIYIKDYSIVPELESGLRPTSGSMTRIVPISHSITRPLAKYIVPGEARDRQGEDHNKSRPPNCPVSGVHYTSNLACLRFRLLLWLEHSALPLSLFGLQIARGIPTASAYQTPCIVRTSVRKSVFIMHRIILPRRLSLTG